MKTLAYIVLFFTIGLSSCSALVADQAESAPPTAVRLVVSE